MLLKGCAVKALNTKKPSRHRFGFLLMYYQYLYFVLPT